MLQNTFQYRPVETESGTFHLLTAQEYPWLNIQIVTFDPSEHDAAIEKLRTNRGGWIVEHPDRRDFAVIHAGGSGKLHFTQSNYQQLCADMLQCLHNAAHYWATTHPETEKEI